MRRLSVAIAIGLLVGVCATAQAALLWYDGVDLQQYVVGVDNLGGQSGGAGTFFTNPWQMDGGHSVLDTSLERNVIHPTIGGKIGDPDPQGCCIIGRNMHPFASPWGGDTAPVGTIYMGFLANWGKGPTLHHRAVEMYNGDITNDQFRTLQLGYSEWTGLGSHLTLMAKNDVRLVAGNRDVFDTLDENVDFTVDHGTTHFVVLRFDFNESDFDPETTADDDVVSVYLDPVGLTEPAVPSAQLSVDDMLATHMGALTSFVFGNATAPAFDELRVADNSDGMGFADVANNTCPYVPWVPEPASALLIGLGLLGLLAVRRK